MGRFSVVIVQLNGALQTHRQVCTLEVSRQGISLMADGKCTLRRCYEEGMQVRLVCFTGLGRTKDHCSDRCVPPPFLSAPETVRLEEEGVACRQLHLRSHIYRFGGPVSNIRHSMYRLLLLAIHNVA